MAINRFLAVQRTSDFTDEGTTKDANAHVIDVVSEDITTELGWVYPTTSAQRQKRNRLKGGITTSGEFQIPMYPLHATSAFAYVLGVGTTGAAQEDVYPHKMTLKRTIPFFKAFVNKDLKEHVFVGGIAKTATIDYEVNEPVLLSMDSMFRKEIVKAPGTATIPATYNTDDKMFSGSTTVTRIAATDSATLGDATPSKNVESASVEINNTAVEDNFVLGSQFLPNGFVQEVEISGSMSFNFRDANKDDYATYISADGAEPAILLENSRGTFGDSTNGSKHRYIGVTLHKVSFDTGSLPTEGNDRYVFEADFMVETGDVTGRQTPITVVVRNKLTNVQFYA